MTKHQNPDTLKKLNEAKRAKKELEQQEYFDPKLADEERERGNEFFKQMKYPEAVEHYTEVLKRNPKDPRVYNTRAACYTKLGALPEALKDADKCIELDPTFTKGYTRNGAVRFFIKEYEKRALETYQEGLKHDANHQELRDGVRRLTKEKDKGNAAFAAGSFADPIKQFTDAINLSPTNDALFSNRSSAYASSNRFSDALSDAKKTVELNPNWPEDYSRLGAAYLDLNNVEEAIESYEKGLAIDPNNKALKSGLSEAKRKINFNGDAANPFCKTFEGLEMCAKLTADPTARAYLQQPDFVEMVHDVQKEAQEEEEAGNAAYKEEFKMAIEHYSKAMELDEECNEFFKQMKYPEAVEHYTEALKRNPKDPRVYNKRAACYTKLGALPEALKDADKCMELDPTFTKGYTRNGAVQFFIKEYEKRALETYQEGLKQ